MQLDRKTPNRWIVALTVIFLLSSILFSFLWLKEKTQKPNEVTIEVEKEVIKEIEKPIEIIKEVPVKLSDEESNYLLLGKAVAKSKNGKSEIDVLKKIHICAIVVSVDERLKNVISEEVVKNRFELNLRQYGIVVGNKAGGVLMVYINGFLRDSVPQYIYDIEISLMERILTFREKDIYSIPAIVWNGGSFGVAGAYVAEDKILKSMEEQADKFANAYLKAND